MEVVLSRAFKGVAGLDADSGIGLWGGVSGGLLLAALGAALTAHSIDGQNVAVTCNTIEKPHPCLLDN